MSDYQKYKARRKKLLAIKASLSTRQSKRPSKKQKVVIEEIENFTEGINYLNGIGDWDSLQKCWGSYGPDEEGKVCCTVVGPTFGPLRIYGPNALKAFNRLGEGHE